MKHFLSILLLFASTLMTALEVNAQHQQITDKRAGQTSYISKVWVADKGDGSFKNPILHADYSDPDAIRVGEDYYMISSSFDAVPGLPILHSKDLVNWTILGHALLRQPPYEHFSKTQHGNGVWAPALRFHRGEFYIYYPDPDFGIYMIKTKNPSSTWSAPVLVESGKGLIDPCPLWDDDGRVYLAYAYAGSRAGIKSVLAVKELNASGTSTITSGKLVYDGHLTDPTIEGPKFYKRNGFYYLFAPAGGVSTGWQLVLRSKSVYGPYQRKVVMDQGTSPVNGPHQGAWVNTQTGEDWFLHFQDKGLYGRVVHLQPMKWVDDWPVIGMDTDRDGKGEPVMTFKKPNVGKIWPIQTPSETDEFNGTALGLQWQWQANPKPEWSFLNAAQGSLRLYTNLASDSVRNLYELPAVLMQKFPAESFSATTKLTFTPNPKLTEESTGLIVMGMSYAYIGLQSEQDGSSLVYSVCINANKGKSEVQKKITKLKGKEIYLRVKVSPQGQCRFSYSINGQDFIDIPDQFTAEAGQWIGAKVGLFAIRKTQTNDSGYADFDYFRIH